MKAEFILKVVIPPFIIFAILVWLTAEHYISGWVMYLLWVIGFVVANIIVTKISTRWSIQRMREKRAKEEKIMIKVIKQWLSRVLLIALMLIAIEIPRLQLISLYVIQRPTSLSWMGSWPYSSV